MRFCWEPLKKGDIIDIVAPGSGFDKEQLLRAVDELQSLGFKARFDEKILATYYFHSNTDEERFKQLKKALLAKDSKAIWCFRGGYGSNRLLPMLEKMSAPKKVKPLIGISDITSLMVFLNQKWKWPTLHATLADRIGGRTLPEDIKTELFKILEGHQDKVEFQGLKPMNAKAEKVKSLSSSVVGGNLTVVQSTLGTQWQIKGKDRLVFFEDLNERGYRVDRMLEHIKQAKVFDKASGVLFGHFLGGSEVNPQGERKKELWSEALQRFADEIKIPVWQGVESGHGERLRALPMNTSAEIKKSKNSSNEFSLSIDVGSQ